MNDWLTHRARATPDSTALVAADTGREWDYAELDAAVERTAGRLAALGVTAGDHLGVLLPSRVVYVRLVHAAMRLGATLVPLSDRLTATELADQIETADLTALVCGAETEARAVEAAGGVPAASVDDPESGGVASLSAAEPVAFDPASWEHDDPLAMLFTSGTTGAPKAVVLTAGNVFHSAVASAFRLGVAPDDRWLVALSLYHMGGLAPLYRSALYGTAVVLRTSFDPGGTADDVGAYGATGISLVPTMLRRMLDSRGTLSDSLRFVLLGGAPAPRSLVRRCRDYSVPVCPTYGMTETASQIATASPGEAFEFEGTVGRPLLWTDLAVVGDEGDEVAPGEIGEFVVSGATVSPGYYGNPEATADAFGPRGLRTGDVGYRDEAGRVYVLGRIDDRIITGGENVDPGEVAEALRDCPGVAEAAVVGLPDDEWGERVAALVVRDDPDLTADAVEAHCRERLAGYKLPRTIAFEEGELPRTASGTVERPAVRERIVSLVEAREADGEDGVAEADTADGVAAAAESGETNGEDGEDVESGEDGDGEESGEDVESVEDGDGEDGREIGGDGSGPEGGNRGGDPDANRDGAGRIDEGDDAIADEGATGGDDSADEGDDGNTDESDDGPEPSSTE
ncbi:AMP-binding protein [Halegenticoccus soli]|uniref:AMP-binding protein n=1 Tax=Halegenticoccus soli TaxID=1985678 RepID=UPI000C6CCC1A|nr:AMP-binding protein [Halegenticoccus soli]